MSIGAVNSISVALPHVGSVATGISPHGIPADVAADQRHLIQAVKSVNSAELFGDNSEMTFFFDRESGKFLVRVIDRATRQVLTQIPAQQVVEMAREAKR